MNVWEKYERFKSKKKTFLLKQFFIIYKFIQLKKHKYYKFTEQNEIKN